MNIDPSTVFEDVVRFPDAASDRAFEKLVGLDDVKNRLVKEAMLAIDPKLLGDWCKTHHNGELPLLDTFADRPPLFILAGDVGTGKTALARSFGSIVAQKLNTSVLLYAPSLNARGTGAVGEMTRLISTAFSQVQEACGKSRDETGKAGRCIVLLIDEADALAQSREFAQMHHEDRAGVNALIRGIDDIASARLPVVVVMCTNRLTAIDPAVRRRAAGVFTFARPSGKQRESVLRSELKGVGFTDPQLAELVTATGRNGQRAYGYTYSDLVQRLVPSLVLDAFPDNPIRAERALEIAHATAPTPPFEEEES